MIRSVLLEPVVTETTDRRGRTRKEASFPIQWELKKPINRVFFKAGSTIFCGTNGMIAAVQEPAVGTGISQEGDQKEVSLTTDFLWKSEIEGDPFNAIAADNKLFVVTKEGKLLCYGDKVAEPVHHNRSKPAHRLADDWSARAENILNEAGTRGGYAVLLGAGSGNLAETLVQKSEMNLVIFEPDKEKVRALREKWATMGIYGSRIALIPEDLGDSPISPYFAHLITAEDPIGFDTAKVDSLAKVVFDCLRPYGGKAILPLQGEREKAFEDALAKLSKSNAEWKTTESGLTLTKVGALPGSAPWTHQYGDIANPVSSKEKLVKAPLGILWFGGPSHLDVLPRHGHGPPQQVIGGRLFIQGIQVLSARDVYTGRILWRKELPNLDTHDMYYNDSYVDDPYDLTYNQRHIPGANQYGTNFIATEDLLYLTMEEQCLVIDPVTGETLKVFKLPELSG
ncbi:MAG: hypothetical protein KC931_21615, partial [Candidatus Omnitrophica bacterium]|nr:hypothetical protein [Candidatus Omnitrophota bacterium]